MKKLACFIDRNAVFACLMHHVAYILIAIVCGAVGMVLTEKNALSFDVAFLIALAIPVTYLISGYLFYSFYLRRRFPYLPAITGE